MPFIKYRIIGLVGKHCVGKDSVANYLKDNYGYTNRKFSTPLKNCLKSLFDFTDDQLESNQKDLIDPKWGITPRKAMQYFDTEIMQHQLPTIIPNIHRDFFVKRLFLDFNHYTQPFSISDVRFEHEANAIKKYGGILIKIERNNTNINDSDDHISEKDIDNIICDHIIQNNSDLMSLNSKIKKIIDK